jgi:hypothetical protein
MEVNMVRPIIIETNSKTVKHVADNLLFLTLIWQPP